MATHGRVLRGIPLWLMREYLEEIGGTIQSDFEVHGPGWVATLTQMEPHKIGSLRIGQVQLDLVGDSETLVKLTQTIDMKTLRGGG